MAPRLRLIVALAFVAVTIVVLPAEAVVLDRMVAIVDRKAIFLSELKERAAPHLLRIRLASPNQAQQAAMESQMFRELLSRMVDEELERQDAARMEIRVEEPEIDRGLDMIAAQHFGGSREKLLEEAEKQGVSQKAYREEIARQVLEGKWLIGRLRLRNKPVPSDPKALEEIRKKEIEVLRQHHFVEIRL